MSSLNSDEATLTTSNNQFFLPGTCRHIKIQNQPNAEVAGGNLSSQDRDGSATRHLWLKAQLASASHSLQYINTLCLDIRGYAECVSVCCLGCVLCWRSHWPCALQEWMELHSSTGGRPIETFWRNLILVLQTWVNLSGTASSIRFHFSERKKGRLINQTLTDNRVFVSLRLYLFGSGGLSAASLALKRAENAPAAAAAFQDTIKHFENLLDMCQILSNCVNGWMFCSFMILSRGNSSWAAGNPKGQDEGFLNSQDKVSLCFRLKSLMQGDAAAADHTRPSEIWPQERRVFIFMTTLTVSR